MIQSEITSPVTLTSNSDVVRFQDYGLSSCRVKCQNGGWLNHSAGSPLFQITKDGIYDIEINGTYSSDTAGTVALAIYEDGIPNPSTIRATTLAAAGDLATFDTSLSIETCKVGATLTVGSVPSVLSGATFVATETQAPVITSANLTIKRRG